jgi:hypothetical protein
VLNLSTEICEDLRSMSEHKYCSRSLRKLKIPYSFVRFTTLWCLASPTGNTTRSREQNSHELHTSCNGMEVDLLTQEKNPKLTPKLKKQLKKEG